MLDPSDNCWLPLNSRCRSAPAYNERVNSDIRDFQPTDFETLWRIDQECFSPGISYSQAELRAYMRRSGSFTLVAVGSKVHKAANSDLGTNDLRITTRESPAMPTAEGSLNGFIVAEADGNSGHVITIDVVKVARRAGIGSLLLEAAEERLRAARCRSVELETAVDNISALSFYNRHGYYVTKTFPRYYSNGVDALVLEKRLNKN